MAMRRLGVSMNCQQGRCRDVLKKEQRAAGVEKECGVGWGARGFGRGRRAGVACKGGRTEQACFAPEKLLQACSLQAGRGTHHVELVKGVPGRLRPHLACGWPGSWEGNTQGLSAARLDRGSSRGAPGC